MNLTSGLSSDSRSLFNPSIFFIVSWVVVWVRLSGFSRDRPGGGDVHPSPRHLWSASSHVYHYACRNLLWGDVWGSTTSIMVNIPGEPSSVITCLDGYQMARRGRLGPALGMSAMALSLEAPQPHRLAFFGLPLPRLLCNSDPRILCHHLWEHGLIDLLEPGIGGQGLRHDSGWTSFGHGRIDSISGIARFDFGSPYLLDGIDFIHWPWAFLDIRGPHQFRRNNRKNHF